MSSLDHFLTDYSCKNLWQAPGQDIQHVISPSRITPRRGALGRITLGMKEYTLPSKGDWYSVFVLGDIPHFMVGVDEYIDRWVSAEYHSNTSNTYIVIYNNIGMTYPCFETFFIYTRDGQVAIALKNHQKTINVLDDDIFIKWRSSSYFNIVENLVSGEGIKVRGREIKNNNDISTMTALWTTLRARKGHVWAWRNGRRIHRVHSNTVKVGDILEIIWDGSVREVISKKLKNLNTFDSTMDKKSKYLFDVEGYGDTIDYRDDVDFFLLEHKNENEYDGIYYHHNQIDAIRNVTHRDFSIPTSYIVGLIVANVRWNLSHDNRLEMIVRHSGWIRPIPNVHNRLCDLFKLDHNKRIEAMLGEHSLIPEWTADNLESSNFNKLISSHNEPISKELATNALGYNAVSKVASKSFHKREGKSSFRLNTLHHYRSTVYEYNLHGKLIGVYRHSLSPDYYPKNESCEFIESYIGWGGPNMGTVFGKETQKLNLDSSYKFYIAYKKSSTVFGEWQDVTGDSTKYNIDEEGNLTWLVDKSFYLTATRRDCDFLSTTLELDRTDRLLMFSIQTDNVYQDRGELKGWLEIPPGELDVFLNGHHLVEDIDYHVNWPEVCIVNTLYRSQNIVNEIHVRARGFCDENLKRIPNKDFGFIYNRGLGRRDKYQVFEDKNMVVHASGRIVPLDLIFNEDWSRKETLSGFNGKPFQIRYPVSPLRNVTSRKTLELKDESEDLDIRIEDYLTDKLGIVDNDLPRDIDNKYILVSPFMSKLLHDLLNGIFPIDEFKESYSNELLMDRVARYNYLLPYEPTLQKHYMPKFVEVHPHPYIASIEVNVYQYRILDKVSKILFNDLVSLDKSLLIIESGFEHDARYHPHPRRIL